MKYNCVKENGMSKKIPYSVPEGYFDGLTESLSSIPGRQVSGWRPHLSPYFALAAMFATAVILGNIFVQRNEPAGGSASEDEIVEYLIESGVTLAQLEETENY